MARAIPLEVGSAGHGISTMGGGPRLSPGMTIPICRRCGKPMSLVLQLELGGDVPPHAPAGSRLLVFACLDHDDPPATVAGERLPSSYWNLGQHYQLLLAPPGTAAMYASDPRVDERSLIAGPPIEEAGEVGAPGLKIGGVPAWAGAPERRTCACGAPMAFVAQVPAGFEIPEKTGTSSRLFRGQTVYVFSCSKACDPRAVWPVTS